MDFLARKRRGDPPGIIAVHGDSHFLRREAKRVVRDWVVGDAPSEFVFSTYDGESAGAAVIDELFTPPFVGERRLIAVEDADDFVSRHRPALEKLARSPSRVGVLTLDVRTWAVTTKLAQAVELAIQCGSPKPSATTVWCSKWAEQRYEKKLDHVAADALIEQAGHDLGVLDQEIAKLANFVDERDAITREDVVALAAGRGEENVFGVLNAALDGRLPEALWELDRALGAGEPPVKILAIFSSQIRKFGEAYRRRGAKIPVEIALRDAGIPPFAIRDAERRLMALGRERAAGLYRELLAADLAVKGGSEQSPRTILERLLTWLATGVR